MVSNSDFLNENNPEIPADLREEIEHRQGELHLRFYLSSGDEFALPAMGIKEVMQQEPDRITPIPNASDLLLGTINLRGKVIWVADLGSFLQDMAVLNTERAEIPVIAIEDQDLILGLAVERLGEMEWLDVEDLQMPINVPDYIAPYVQGEWVFTDDDNGTDKTYLRLLDQVAILRSARWVTLRSSRWVN
ncbi:chemotaxis protein CheW [Gloeocapsa sp. PCC 73106]|uniref:chemotaxis protein CheW n=1 Tax=Gloeocapsa sp. PCC 73106 TaxID=102232 RepID=UPI0002AB9BE8|nr:chemotaxis protein CheW [Gloeocapsa sp. PCC 73106]ELR96382.1 chemotaxis signal transduction protein [Gloeocapsa sp. PCC 73106]